MTGDLESRLFRTLGPELPEQTSDCWDWEFPGSG